MNMERYEKKKELSNTRNEYAQKRITFVDKFEELKSRKSVIENEREDQTKMFQKFFPFLELCRKKIATNRNKIIIERFVIKKLTDEAEKLKATTIYLQQRLVKLEQRVQNYKKIKDFMERIVRENRTINETHELINRYEGLVQCNNRLKTIQEEANDTLARMKRRRQDFKIENEHLDLYNQLIHLNNELSIKTWNIKKLRQQLDTLGNAGRQNHVIMANICQVTGNLYRTINPNDFTNDTFAQLTKIAIYGEQLEYSIRQVFDQCKREKIVIKALT